MGLGLYICKAIADALHGQVGVDSKEGCGSRFWFDVPLRYARIHKTLADSDSSEFFDASDMHVLVVEDHAINQKVIAYLLKDYHCRLTIAQ